MKFSRTKQRDGYMEEVSVIAGGVVLDRALVTGSSDIAVKGIVNGDIDLDGDVNIGVEGQVNGNITCKNCIINGAVQGGISCSGELVISQYGELKGNISVESFTIERGGRFAGMCNQAPQKITPVVLRDGKIPDKSAIGTAIG